MAIVTVPAFLFPVKPEAASMAAFGSFQINAAGEKYAQIFRAPKAGTLDKYEFRIGNVTTAQDLKVSFQNVDLTTGFPDGTVDQFRVVPSASVIANSWIVPGLITSDGTDGGAKRTVTQSELLAAVIEFDSAIGDVAFSSFQKDINEGFSGFPYTSHFTASWARNTHSWLMALKYNDATYSEVGLQCWPLVDFDNATLGLNTTPDELGIIFQLPYRARVRGCYGYGTLGNEIDIILYDSNGSTVLATAVHDPELRGNTSTDNDFEWYFDTSIILSANTNYRVVYKGKVAGTVTLRGYQTSTSTIMDAIPGTSTCKRTERTDAGSWSETATRRPEIGLVIDGIDIPGAGGAFVY